MWKLKKKMLKEVLISDPEKTPVLKQLPPAESDLRFIPRVLNDIFYNNSSLSPQGSFIGYHPSILFWTSCPVFWEVDKWEDCSG